MSTAPEIEDHPVAVLIPLDADWGVRLKAAERLRHAMQGQRPRQWFTKQRRIRISRALRTDDARHSGAALRDIATVYFGRERIAAEPWKTSSLKAHTARLAYYGERLASGGYRQILRGKTK